MTGTEDRSVVVRLAMDPSSYMAGATRAASATTALQREVSKVGPATETSMARAAKSSSSAETALGRVNKSAGALGFTLGGLAGVGAGVGAAMSVKWAGDYQSALTRLVTTAGESQKNIKMVGKGFLDMAGQVGISADEIAKGAYIAESAGYHGAAALTVMKAATQGAKQENADLGKVTDALSTILHDYHLPASQAATVTSQLITAVSHGKTTFDELTGSLHSVTPLASKMNISLADVTGTLAAMTASGESADQSTQNMANTLQHLASPTSTMIAELAQLGVSTDDLQKSLSSRGLAGTLQMVEEAIVQHVDPATQRVLLPALNKSKTAVQDLTIMMGQMPPDLAKLSKGLQDGSVSIMNYQKAAKNLGGQQGAMALQFLSLLKSSQGFSNVLKGGGPAAQVFTAAMSKAFGTTAALNVALQTTGENAASTNAAIKDIASASAQADGNIKGWDEVQANFNQRLAEAEAGAKSFAIEAGQHLLPILTDVLGYVHDHGPAALHDLGVAFHVAETAAQPLIATGGGVLHVFQELPGPIKDVVVGLVALKAAASMGWLDGLATGGGKVKAAFAGVREEMALQQSLYAMNARSAAGMGTQVRTLAQEMESLSGSTTAGGNSLGTFGAVRATAAVKGMSALKSAGSGVVGLFGGPWGLALTGAALTVGEFASALGAGQQRIDGYATSLLGLYKQQDLGGQSAIDASNKLADYQKKVDDAQKALDAATKATHSYGEANYGSALGTAFAGQSVDELRAGLVKAKDELSSYHAKLSILDTAQIRVTRAENDLQLVMKNSPGNTAAVSDAAAKLRDARTNLTTVTNTLAGAEKSHLQVMQDEANVALAAVNSNLAAQQAQLGLSAAIVQYNKDAHDGQHSAAELKQEQLSLAQSAISAAQAAGQAAADQAKANGATDTATIAQKAELDSLKRVASQLTGPGRDAVEAQIRILERSTTATNITQEAMANLGLTVNGLPDGHLITIDAPTAKQEAALHHLGYVTVTLPDGKVVVTADTHPALAEIQSLLAYARTQSIVLRAGMSDLNGSASGTGRMGTFWGGGWTGPGAKYTPAGVVHADEFVVQKESRASIERQAPGALDYMNRTGMLPGYVGGGIVIPTSISPASIAGIEGSLHAASAAYTAALASLGNTTASGPNAAIVQQIANGYGWGSGAEWAALVSVINRESGFRNTAQNPTSTAYGMFQFLDSTWGSVGGYKTSDARLQAIFGERYIAQRYGDPLGALRHEQAFGWYKDGTPYVPRDGLAYLHQGERVVTAADNTAIRTRTREIIGAGSGGGGTVMHTDARSYPITVQAAPDPAAMIRRLQDAQRDAEFLYG